MNSDIWYKKYFLDNYLTFNASKEVKDNLLDKSNKFLNGSFNRINNIYTFAYLLNIDIVNTICITFKLKEMSTDKDVIFSFGYFNYEKNMNKKNLYKYFTVGGSYISKDGEYRLSFLNYNNIVEIKENPKTRNIFYDFKTYLKNNLSDRGLIITKDFFYPIDEKKTLEVEMEYYSFELQYDLLTMTWLELMLKIYYNIVENHINDKFKYIFLKYKKEDFEFFNSRIKNYDKNNLIILRRLCNNILHNKLNKKNTLKIGQKTIPLTISEAQEPFNIKFKPWREYMISMHLSDYVINNISAGFFLTNSWFYIKNSRKGLFDNDVQFKKMKRSEIALQITELLNRAQIYTYDSIIDKTGISSHDVDSWISNKFKELSNKIQDPIDYAKQDIIMSNVALCMISEYVGRTLWDFMLLSKSSTYYNNLVGCPFSKKGYPYFAKYMFELCYNLYAINSISGIIHGDLHLNNVTINTIKYGDIEIQNPQVLYVISDDFQYIFPSKHYNLCLIDFSRSIILPNKLEKIKDSFLPKTYEILNEIEEFQKDQVERLLYLYMNYTSDNINKKNELRVLFTNKFEAVFKLLTTIDLYSITSKMIKSFKIKDKKIPIPDKYCLNLLTKLNKYANQFITVEMNKLINDPKYEQVILEMENPIFTIIKLCFYEFDVNNSKIGNIIDIYNVNNDMKYSINKLSDFPPHIKELNSATQQYDLKNDITARKKFEKEKLNGLKIVDYISKRQKTKYN